MPPLINLAGNVYGELTVVHKVPRRKNKTVWLVVCSCGASKRVRGDALTSGAVISCGHIQRDRARENATIHGWCDHPLYVTWNCMLQRCENPKAINYKRYGGRGITVCERWHEFSLFVADMGERPQGKTLDRIDNNLGYYKENCRWSTPKQQTANRRRNCA